VNLRSDPNRWEAGPSDTSIAGDRQIRHRSGAFDEGSKCARAEGPLHDNHVACPARPTCGDGENAARQWGVIRGTIVSRRPRPAGACWGL